MIKKYVQTSYAYAPIIFSKEQWEDLDSIIGKPIEKVVRNKIVLGINSYLRSISEYASGVRQNEVKNILQKLGESSRALCLEMEKILPGEVQWDRIARELGKFERGSPEWVMKALKLSENPDALEGEEGERAAAVMAHDAICKISIDRIGVDLDIRDICNKIDIISKCALSISKEIPTTLGREGDPYLDEFIMYLHVCFLEANGIGIYKKEPIDCTERVIT